MVGNSGSQVLALPRDLLSFFVTIAGWLCPRMGEVETKVYLDLLPFPCVLDHFLIFPVYEAAFELAFSPLP